MFQLGKSEKERQDIATEEEKADALRQKKLAEARKLIMDMSIQHSNDVPRPAEPGTVMKGEVDLQTNLFGIQMTSDVTIFKYDVMIGCDTGTKYIEFSKKGRSDYVVSERKRNCVAVFFKAIKNASFHSDSRVYFYDGQSLLYTTEKIVFKDENKPNETIMIEGAQVCQELESFKYIELVIKECDTGFMCRLSDLRKIDRDAMKKDRTATQFVDVATSMNALFQSDRFTVFGNGKMFPNHPDVEKLKTVPMKEGKVMIPGMTKSIKLIEGPRGRSNTCPAVAIDSLKVAFHVKETVVDKAIKFCVNVNSPTPSEMDAFSTAVFGLGCTTNHMKKQRRVEIHGIAKDNAHSKKMEMNLEGGKAQTVTVAEYFKIKYCLDLKYPLAPLVMSRERGQVNLYPMELLDIIPMQRVTIPQTSSAQSQVATKECAVPPGIRQNAIMDQCKLHDFFNPNQPFLKACGLGIMEVPLKVKGRVLKGPVLQYKTSVMEVLQANWKPPMNFKFLVPGSLSRWSIYGIVSPRDSFSRADLSKFAEAFARRCRERGMEAVAPSEIEILPQPPEGKTPDFWVREKIKSAAVSGHNFLFFVTNDFINVHKHMKLQERYSGVVTQDLKLKTCMNYLEKGQSLTMDNIVYKTNLKLGGINYAINLKNLVGTRVDPFKPTRLFLGIGVSQAPQMNVFTETGVKIPAPSVVGFAANMARHPTEFIGDFICQNYKKDDLLLCTTEMLQRVIDRFTGAVDDNGVVTKVKTKPLPTEMIVYRQGVGEGFYGMCVKEEIPLMKAVLAANEVKDFKLTYIIVQKEHNVRLMPAHVDAREKATVQNITSGVVLDSVITHPRYREFFLNSHITLQGTARTPRYTVLHDDANMAMNELQSVTHALCHDFQIVNSPVSIPAPLYIANRYSERGVNLYSAKATDELATSHQKARITNEDYNVHLAYGPTKLGKVRINA